MAYRRYGKRKFRGRRKRWGRRRSSRRVARRTRFRRRRRMPLAGRKNKEIVKLRYTNVESQLIGSVPGLGAEMCTYRMNSIYDPNCTGVGGYCPGYSDYVGKYEKYKVVKSVITRSFLPVYNAQAVTPMACVMSLDNDSTGIAGTGKWYDYRSVPHHKSKVMNVNVYKDKPTSVMSQVYTDKGFWDSNLDNRISSFGSNPVTQCYSHCTVWDAALAGVNPPCICITTIDYYVLFSNPTDIAM